MANSNRRWLLRSRPEGKLKVDDFALDEQPFEEPELQDGEVLVRTGMFSCAPTMRNWMNDPSRSYRASVGLGEPVIGVAGGYVEKSRHPRFPVGSKVTGVLGWEDYRLLAPDRDPHPVLAVPDDVSLEDAMGVLGANAMTAYFGLLRVGDPKPGETVVVSAAAGSTGSVAAQIARIKGCRVIGIAGGAAKCARLTEELRLDAAIDYKKEDVSERLRELCPNGIDLFFDNVGGDILQAVMDNIAVFGRVVVCGQIAAYDSADTAPGPRDMMKVVYWRVRIEGFVLGDFAKDADMARADLKRWRDEGQLVYRTDVRSGFEALPRTFLDLFSGNNDGALLVRSN
ncbi:NADP-dependent oxidoreductase [Sphingomonas tabacisoli]|uniref:NADP-dependent oxidoreductase n=1 Tax=Sphingomonas tabacisoli TaxID=2249466 RepID=A0ABW4I3H8_9SPHN